MNKKRYRELAAASLANALQLQSASRLLFKHGYWPTSVALAVMSDEETAKSILFAIAMTEPTLLPGLTRLLHNHRAKQALAAFVAQFADSVGPALRAVRRVGSRVRKQTPHATHDEMTRRLQDEAIRVMKARARRRLTTLDRSTLLVGDIQTTKNNCLYAGLDHQGKVTVPQRVATRKFAKAYLAALDNRLYFYTYAVLGNLNDGRLTLADVDRRLIRESWQTFAARFARRSKP